MHKHKLLMHTPSFLRILLVLALLFIFASSPFVVKSYESIGEDSFSSAIDRAEGVVVSAYRVVLEAERVGADISGLADQLSVAAGLLVQAHFQYEAGNFSGAVYFAGQCYGIGEGVETEAYGLRDRAAVDGVQRFWLMIMAWVISLVVIICGGFFGWRIFKRRYHRKILRLKPEVSSSES